MGKSKFDLNKQMFDRLHRVIELVDQKNGPIRVCLGVLSRLFQPSFEQGPISSIRSTYQICFLYRHFPITFINATAVQIHKRIIR